MAKLNHAYAEQFLQHYEGVEEDNIAIALANAVRFNAGVSETVKGYGDDFDRILERIRREMDQRLRPAICGYLRQHREFLDDFFANRSARSFVAIADQVIKLVSESGFLGIEVPSADTGALMTLFLLAQVAKEGLEHYCPDS